MSGTEQGLLQSIAEILGAFVNELFETLSLRRLALIGIADPSLKELRKIPKENHLLDLDLTANGLTNDSVRALAAWKRLPRLRRLSLQFNRLDDGIVGFFNHAHFFRGLERIHLGANPFTPDGRGTLLGFSPRGPITFDVERDSDHLYTLPADFYNGCFKPGTASDHRQLLLGGTYNELRIALFDFEGNLLQIDRRPWTTHDPEREGDDWLAEFGFVPGPIRVKRFRFGPDEGIIDFSWQDEFDGNDPELEGLIGSLASWVRTGQFRYRYAGSDDFWLDRTGEVVAT